MQCRSARCPRPSVSTMRPRRESMRTTLRLDSSVTQTLPPPTAMPRPSAPVGILSTTRPRSASIFVTVRSSALVTQTVVPSTASAVGVRPTGIVSTSRFVCGSIRDTVASSEFATQTAPPPTAIPPGSPPTSMRWTTPPVSGSTRDTVSSAEFTTQTAPSPAATLVGPLPTGTSATSRLDPVSSRRDRVRGGGREPRAVVAGELAGGDGNRSRQENGCADRDQDAASARTRNQRAGLSRRRIELRILIQDRALELLQPPAGLEAELVGEHPARLPVHVERLRLAARAVEGEHELSAQTLPQRVLRGRAPRARKRARRGGRGRGRPRSAPQGRPDAAPRGERSRPARTARTRSPTAAVRARGRVRPAGSSLHARARPRRGAPDPRRAGARNGRGRAALARARAGTHAPGSPNVRSRAPCGAERRRRGRC